MIIDATDAVLGRMATRAAKLALLGETVNVVNCEKALISGNKRSILSVFRWKETLGVGMDKGPYLQKRPDKFVRKVIRGMIPYHSARGREAYARVRCHIRVPAQFTDGKKEIVKGAMRLDSLNAKYISVGEICRIIGDKE
ncbi:MAG: 50S ribosomal protein L13 [Candidatus Woesearchaeota archaeon]